MSTKHSSKLERAIVFRVSWQHRCRQTRLTYCNSVVCMYIHLLNYRRIFLYSLTHPTRSRNHNITQKSRFNFLRMSKDPLSMSLLHSFYGHDFIQCHAGHILKLIVSVSLKRREVHIEVQLLEKSLERHAGCHWCGHCMLDGCLVCCGLRRDGVV